MDLGELWRELEAKRAEIVDAQRKLEAAMKAAQAVLRGPPAADAASGRSDVRDRPASRPVACQRCGAGLTGGPKQRFCSRRCRDAAQRERARRRDGPAPDGGGADLSPRYRDDERAAIEQALAEGRVTRIERGEFPDLDRPALSGGWHRARAKTGTVPAPVREQALELGGG